MCINRSAFRALSLVLSGIFCPEKYGGLARVPLSLLLQTDADIFSQCCIGTPHRASIETPSVFFSVHPPGAGQLFAFLGGPRMEETPLALCGFVIVDLDSLGSRFSFGKGRLDQSRLGRVGISVGRLFLFGVPFIGRTFYRENLQRENLQRENLRPPCGGGGCRGGGCPPPLRGGHPPPVEGEGCRQAQTLLNDARYRSEPRFRIPKFCPVDPFDSASLVLSKRLKS